MSSTTPPSGPSPLSARERLALETMVHHECRHDPAFVARLTTWAPQAEVPARRRRDAGAFVVVVAALVVQAVLVGLALAGLVALAAAGVVLMLVAPVALVVWARRRSSP